MFRISAELAKIVGLRSEARQIVFVAIATPQRYYQTTSLTQIIPKTPFHFTTTAQYYHTTTLPHHHIIIANTTTPLLNHDANTPPH